MADLTKGSPSTSRPVSTSSKGSAKRGSSPKTVKSPAKPVSKRKSKSTGKEEEPQTVTPLNDPGLPEDICPLVLTSKTQEIFNCKADQDVTQENPYKTITKEEILHDMKTRGAISDFHPVKQHILDYPGESLLLVFDRDFKYGQNFYLVLTEEAKGRILNPSAESVDEGDDEEILETLVYKPPLSKPWVSLGSEKEIEDESVKDFQKQIKCIISRVRKEFGAPVKFSDRNSSDVKDGYVECTSYDDKKFSIKQLERDTGTQAVPQMQETSSQTKWAYPRNACTQYEPRELTKEEKEALLTSKQLKEFINSVVLRLEVALQQNEIMDAFFDDWKALTEEEGTFGGKSDTHLKEYQSFTDLHGSKERTVSHIGWHPTVHGVIAVALTERLTFEERVNLAAKLILTPSLILIWSFADPLHPKLQLECPDDVYCFQFCPSDPNIIAGGCINGQVVLWDISAYAERLQSGKTGGGKQTAVDGTTLVSTWTKLASTEKH
ncbi:dynein axonemal intermediate chain 3 [Protopterus annectens]|uniref:dynein axonemal intermediate chain 3 n=1 Tax=Protopterus annectens TaxID=7888 RepID=UPI001CFA8124|nr:dynein axonemal intermediate chain 3 [Protopterus annectens]